MRYFLVFFFIMLSGLSRADFIMIGDSVFTHRNQEIKRLIETSQNITIKNHAVTGAWFKNIVSQFEKSGAKEGDTIIMDGGGNDIFGNAGNCRGNMNANCKSQIDGIAEKMKDLLDKMLPLHLKHVFFMSPYYTQGWNGSGYERAINYGIETVLPICNDHLVQCIFIDVRFVMKGNVLEYDGIHPNGAGTKILSNSIIEAMRNAK